MNAREYNSASAVVFVLDCLAYLYKVGAVKALAHIGGLIKRVFMQAPFSRKCPIHFLEASIWSFTQNNTIPQMLYRAAWIKAKTIVPISPQLSIICWFKSFQVLEIICLKLLWSSDAADVRATKPDRLYVRSYICLCVHIHYFDAEISWRSTLKISRSWGLFVAIIELYKTIITLLSYHLKRFVANLSRCESSDRGFVLHLIYSRGKCSWLDSFLVASAPCDSYLGLWTFLDWKLFLQSSERAGASDQGLKTSRSTSNFF